MATTEKKKSTGQFEAYDDFKRAMIGESENKQLFAVIYKGELVARVAFVQVAAENNGADVTCFVHVVGTLMSIGRASLDDSSSHELYTRAFMDAVSAFQREIERKVHGEVIRAHQVNFFSAGKMCGGNNAETWTGAMDKLDSAYTIRNLI